MDFGSDAWLRLIWGRYARKKYIEEAGTIKTKALNEVRQLLFEKSFDKLEKEQQEAVLALLNM